jgi:hypothetical protein
MSSEIDHFGIKMRRVGTVVSYGLAELNNLLTPCGRVLLEKLVVTQPVKKFPAFYGTERFITVIIRATHWSLSRAR